MTKDEIKKALKCCQDYDYDSCADCPYRTHSENCTNDILQDALNIITEQEKEIKQLKAEYKQLNTNAEILARGVRDLNHENYELTEKVKQAKIDVLNELKKRSYCDNTFTDGKWHRYVLIDDIDKLIEEIENNGR